MGGKGRTVARGKTREEPHEGEEDGKGGLDVGWNNLTRGCLLAHRYATHAMNVSPAVSHLDNTTCMC